MPSSDRRPPGNGIITTLVAGVGLVGSYLLFARPRALRAFEERYGPSTGRGSHGTPPSMQAIDAGFETHDASALSVGRWMIYFLILIVAAIGLMFGLLAYFQMQRQAARPAFSPPPLLGRVEPPAPHLQVHPFQDLEANTQYATKLLNSYQWLDGSHRAARIPIWRAMELTVGRPLDPAGEPAQ